MNQPIVTIELDPSPIVTPQKGGKPWSAGAMPWTLGRAAQAPSPASAARAKRRRAQRALGSSARPSTLGAEIVNE